MNTSGNDIITEFLRHSGGTEKQKWERLIKGESLISSLYSKTTFGNLLYSEDHFWSILYHTGYLTKKSFNFSSVSGENREQRFALTIPNSEIRTIAIAMTDVWFCEVASTANRSMFFEAMWSGDEESFTSQLRSFLKKYQLL